MKRVTVNPVLQLRSERPDLFDATINGIHDVQNLQIQEVGVATWPDANLAPLDTIFAKHYDSYRGQIALDVVLDELDGTNIGAGNTDEKHYLVSDVDMYAGSLNFCFGVTSYAAGVSIQSMARFIQAIPRTTDQGIMARHVARHEYAHLIGMNAQSDYDAPDLRGGIYEGHCANECTIQQVMSVPESVKLVSNLDFYTDAGFCGSCVKRIRTKTL